MEIAVDLRFDAVVCLQEHVRQEASVHAEESVEIHWKDVPGFDVTQVAFVGPGVRYKPSCAEIPAGFGAGFDVHVKLFSCRSAQIARRLKILSNYYI